MHQVQKGENEEDMKGYVHKEEEEKKQTETKIMRVKKKRRPRITVDREGEARSGKLHIFLLSANKTDEAEQKSFPLPLCSETHFSQCFQLRFMAVLL